MPLPRRTKIVATLGPSSESPEMVAALVAGGLDCARLNLSHGSHDEHRARVELVRAAEHEQGRPLAVMADLQGPKLRVARDAEPLELVAGEQVVLYGYGAQPPPGKSIPVDPPVIATALAPGDAVLIDDGLIRLAAQRRQDAYAFCRVEVGGLVKARKGVCAPGVELPIPSLTRKDLDDLAFALALGVDYVALSFVRSAEDVWGLKLQIASLGYDTPIVAKIEQAEALEALEDIVEAADAVMVARGDLAVEIGAERVPLEQKRIVRCALERAKPVIVATQMLESMVHQAQPTRAEASDVANAILDGASAIMLSGETANGDYPRQALETMDRIARHVEQQLEPQPTDHPLDDPEHGVIRAALSAGASAIAERLDAAAVIVASSSGATTAAIARNRPRRPVIGLAEDPKALRRMCLQWGVVPMAISHQEQVEDLWEEALARARAVGVEPGRLVVITAGSRMNVSGSTDLVKIATT